MDDKQLETLLKENYQQHMNTQVHVLEGLEDRVCQMLEGKPNKSAPRQPWMFFPRFKLTFVFAGTAMATLLIGLLIGGTLGLPFGERDYQGVTFVVALPEANDVAVIGDFNGWQPATMTRSGGGIWSLQLDLSPGRYEYAFIIDGVAWKPDPRADEYVKSYGSTNSVMYVDTKGETS